MRSWSSIVALVLLVACRSPADPRGRSAPPPTASVSAVVAPPITSSAAPAPKAVLATSAEPLLVMPLDGDRVAIFLEAEDAAPARGAPKKDVELTLYSHAGMIAVGHPIDEAALSAEARAHVDTAYALQMRHGRPCSATQESIARLHRIPESDPTVSRDPADSDATWRAAMFVKAADGASRVVIARAPGCAGALWATPKSQTPSAMLETRSLSAADAKRVEKLVSKHADFEPAKATSSKGQPKLEVSALGDALVWARVEGTDYAGASACFLLTSGAAPRVLATVTSCPPGVRGAGRSPGDVVSVWFDHARARIEKDEITVSYFPTAYFGIAGSP